MTVKQRPILFSTEMVKALLAGNKTQTRRMIKPQPHESVKEVCYDSSDKDWFGYTTDEMVKGVFNCPYGQKGDILYVRETWAKVPRTAYWHDQTIRHFEKDHDWYIFKAGWERSTSGIRWCSSLHLPKEASTIWLKITDIRVEKLQDISEADSIAEGIGVETIQNQIFYTDYLNKAFARPDPRMSYASLWESINGKDSWAVNPWVWVITFEKVEKP